MKILLVEDDARLAASLGHLLEENGCEVDVVNDGQTGLEWGESDIYDVIILDVMLPKMDGFECVAQLRRRKVATPVLMLTARDAVRDKATGLDSGADDYMTKPFALTELMARLRALTRRHGEVVFETVDFADLSLNLESFDLSCGGETIHLRLKEFLILKMLMLNPSRAISKDSLIENVWGADSDVGYNNVEAHISFLRKKLKFLESRAAIENVPTVGYRIVDTGTAPEVRP